MEDCLYCSISHAVSHRQDRIPVSLITYGFSLFQMKMTGTADVAQQKGRFGFPKAAFPISVFNCHLSGLHVVPGIEKYARCHGRLHDEGHNAQSIHDRSDCFIHDTLLVSISWAWTVSAVLSGDQFFQSVLYHVFSGGPYKFYLSQKADILREPSVWQGADFRAIKQSSLASLPAQDDGEGNEE